MRLVCGNSAGKTDTRNSELQPGGWVGHRSRKLAIRRNAGSEHRLQPEKTQGPWGGLEAADTQLLYSEAALLPLLQRYGSQCRLDLF